MPYCSRRWKISTSFPICWMAASTFPPRSRASETPILSPARANSSRFCLPSIPSLPATRTMSSSELWVVRVSIFFSSSDTSRISVFVVEVVFWASVRASSYSRKAARAFLVPMTANDIEANPAVIAPKNLLNPPAIRCTMFPVSRADPLSVLMRASTCFNSARYFSHSVVPGIALLKTARRRLCSCVRSEMVRVASFISERSCCICSLLDLMIAAFFLISAAFCRYNSVFSFPSALSRRCSCRSSKFAFARSLVCRLKSPIRFWDSSPFTMMLSLKSSSRIAFPIFLIRQLLLDFCNNIVGQAVHQPGSNRLVVSVSETGVNLAGTPDELGTIAQNPHVEEPFFDRVLVGHCRRHLALFGNRHRTLIDQSAGAGTEFRCQHRILVLQPSVRLVEQSAPYVLSFDSHLLQFATKVAARRRLQRTG